MPGTRQNGIYSRYIYSYNFNDKISRLQAECESFKSRFETIQQKYGDMCILLQTTEKKLDRLKMMKMPEPKAVEEEKEQAQTPVVKVNKFRV